MRSGQQVDPLTRLAASKIQGEYTCHRLADPIGNIGRWFAVSLQDGSSDHTLYDIRKECVRFQRPNEDRMIYIQIIPSTMTLQDALTLLKTHRKLYDAGVRMVDPDAPGGGREVIARVTREDQGNQMRSILYGTPPSNLRISN